MVQIFRHSCSEQILYSWKMLLYVYFQVTNHAWVANTNWTPSNFGWIFFFILHSAVIWISASNSSFFYQYFVFNINCAAIEQRISCIFGLYDQFYLLCICGRWLLEPNGPSQFRMEQKGMHVELDLCANPTRKQIVTVSILITVNSQWAHQEVTVSSRFFLMGNNENDFILDQRICNWQCWTENRSLFF